MIYKSIAFRDFFIELYPYDISNAKTYKPYLPVISDNNTLSHCYIYHHNKGLYLRKNGQIKQTIYDDENFYNNNGIFSDIEDIRWALAIFYKINISQVDIKITEKIIL